VKINIF